MGAKKQCCIILAITGDGHKLPSYVVFKHKVMTEENFPQGITVQIQECGWMMTEENFPQGIIVQIQECGWITEDQTYIV
jgi:hypothetical protein